MCGRFTLRTPAHRLAQAFGVDTLPNLRPRYNIAPTQDIVAVRRTDDRRDLAMLRWGLIPGWAKDATIGSRLINARAETVAEKPSFRAAFRQRRCLIAADGFYEWQKAGDGPKQPYFIRLKSDEPFAFAGLWERWRDPAGETVESCTLITTEANETLAPIHPRMPVILPTDAYDGWLDHAVDGAEALLDLLRPYPGGEMIAVPITRRVNNVRNDDAACIEPAAVDKRPETRDHQGQLI